MPDDLIVNDAITIPHGELSFTFVRSSGPGGQNVNKVNTKAVLRWRVNETSSLPEPVRARFLSRCRRRINADGELLITSQRYRDQQRNVQDCLNKLRDLIAESAVAPKPRKKTRPSKAARQRRLNEKKATSEKKQRRRRPELP